MQTSYLRPALQLTHEGVSGTCSCVRCLDCCNWTALQWCRTGALSAAWQCWVVRPPSRQCDCPSLWHRPERVSACLFHWMNTACEGMPQGRGCCKLSIKAPPIGCESPTSTMHQCMPQQGMRVGCIRPWPRASNSKEKRKIYEVHFLRNCKTWQMPDDVCTSCRCS